MTTDKTPHVILADGRQLARGQDYRDGWKVRLITTESVTLAKGAETRSINLFSAPAATAQAPSGFAGVGGFSQVSLTNGEKPGQLGVGAINFILDNLRAIGLSQVQLDQLRSTLGRSMSQQQATQMITAALRGRTVSQAQITNLVQAFVSAGVIPQPAANALTQQLFAQQQNQQLQGIFGRQRRRRRTRRRPERRRPARFRRPRRRRQAGGGNNAGNGGRPRRSAAVPPAPALPAAPPPVLAPPRGTSPWPPADGFPSRLAHLAGQFDQDKATNQ